MAEIISGKDLSAQIKEDLRLEVIELEKKYGRVPHLAVILVGEDPGSVSYVTGKEKACGVVGIKNTTIKVPYETTQEELLQMIDKLNNDDSVDGILVQLPLPKHINEQLVIDSISIEKDADGFHPLNVAGLWLKRDVVYPCTPKGIIRLLDSKNISIEGKNCVVVGRSNIVGLPVSKLLLDRNGTVTVCHSRTKDLASITSKADILVVAIGKAKFLTGDMVKEGAAVIDVGVNRGEDGKLCGDVDFDQASLKASYITPVPGGVGPMTIASLLENTVILFKKHMQK